MPYIIMNYMHLSTLKQGRRYPLPLYADMDMREKGSEGGQVPAKRQMSVS
jgi:hypothetical protein